MNLIDRYDIKETELVTCRQESASGRLLGAYANVEEGADDMLVDAASVEASIHTGLPVPGTPLCWYRERVVLLCTDPAALVTHAALTPSASPLSRSGSTQPTPTSMPGRGRGGHTHPETSVPVVQLRKDTLGLVARYRSIYEARTATGANNIPKCCRREARTSGGFAWMYASDYDRLAATGRKGGEP